MTTAELITTAEELVKDARDNFTQGAPQVAKDKLLTLAGKIIGELPSPAEDKAPTPAKGLW